MAFPGDWSYFKTQQLSASADGALTNFQIQIRVHYGSGSDSGKDVYCGSNCETDFDDIRFANDSDVELDHYLIDKTDSDFALYWVEVDSIAGAGDTEIRVYYGNGGAASASSTNAFLFYDALDDHTSGWSTSGATWSTVSGGGPGGVLVGVGT